MQKPRCCSVAHLTRRMMSCIKGTWTQPIPLSEEVLVQGYEPRMWGKRGPHSCIRAGVQHLSGKRSFVNWKDEPVLVCW